jgi:hypothetical protein
MWIYEPTAEALSKAKRCRCGTFIFLATDKAGKLAQINSLGYQVLDKQKVAGIDLVLIPAEASHFTTCKDREKFRQR